ncbi:MAG: hypothetical protein AB8F95_03160 [Bacteroidia bacterium]
MERRSFIKKAAALSGVAIGMPYILPSGRLFAKTNDTKAGHVVMVLFAGGVRQQESVGMQYLDGSQNERIPGNIMYNMLKGEAPSDKIVYGTDASRPGEIPIPAILNRSLQEQGVLFKEMRATQVGHYGGLNVAVQGNTIVSQGLKQKPINPTIFEYLRRHAGMKATDVWFVGNGIGNSVPLLNHSSHPDYGPQYAANFLAPTVTFSADGFKHLNNAKVYHPEYELDPMYKMKFFLDNNFRKAAQTIGSIGNTAEEKFAIKQFIDDTFDKTQNGTVARPPIGGNPDLTTIGYAAEVMQRFKPKLTVINLNSVDACHGNFTNYLRNLHRADHGVGWLWDYIQNQIPEMANDTVFLALPECGRNLNPNPIKDQNDWLGYDHSDANARRIFGLMAGPNIDANLVIGDEGNAIGESADMVPTIADVFGIKDTVINTGLLSPRARSLFDRI